jgi:DNA-binding CsgD family transcriptional regulator
MLDAAYRDPELIPHLNDVLESVDGPNLAPRLLRTVRRLAPFDRGVVRVITSDGAHRTIFDTALAGTTHWLDEANPPNSLGTADLCRVAALGSKDATTLDLRGQSVPWAGEHEPQFACLVRVSKNTALCLLVSCKRHEMPLDGDAIARLERVAPAVQGALRANWRLWGSATVPIASSSDDFDANVRMALEAFGATQLTPRENDVVRCLLRGESTRGAAATLGIAEATVALHRKRAYAKLGVSSQGQLFARFLRTVGR